MEFAAILPFGAVCLGALTAGAQPAGAQTASIDGVAVNVETSAPLSGVHMMLFTLPWTQSQPLAYGATSGRDGHFSMSAIQPGTYELRAELRGFSHAPSKGDAQTSSISLRSGQHIADLKIEMARHAVIAGRVVDENGDPLANIGIAVVRRAQDSLSANGSSYDVTSDDRGEFRWAGPPGKYYVRADPDVVDSAASLEIRTDGTSQPVYGLSYFPDASSADRAAIVNAEPGKTASGVEIRVMRRRTFTIAGTVTGAPEGRTRFTVVLHGNNDDRSITGLGANFAFTNLLAGDYLLHAEYSSGETRLRSPVLTLKLDDADKINLDLDLTPGGDLVGSVEMPGSLQATLRLVPVKGGYSFLPGEVQKDGSFRFERVPRDQFCVVVGSLPENAYVKSIQFDGAPVTEGILDLTRGAQGSALKIVVSRAGAQVIGAVLDSTGSRVLNSWDGVYLVPDGTDIRLDDRVLVDPGGNFAFHGVRPGRYLLFAAESPFDPDVLRKLAAAAEIITIHEGDHIVRDLRLP
jgi:hypothetical protein